MKKAVLLLAMTLTPFLSKAGMQAPLQSSLQSLIAVSQEIPNQAPWYYEIESLKNIGNDVSVQFKNGCTHLYGIQVEMTPVGHIVNIQAVLKYKNACSDGTDGTSLVPFGGICCSKLKRPTAACAPGC